MIERFSHLLFSLVLLACCSVHATAQNTIVSIPSKKTNTTTTTSTSPSAATTTTTTTSSSGSSSSTSSSTSASGTINGHEYVDLGLSVKWATCNVGASSPEDYGNYYAWGETSTKSSYDEDNSKTYGKSFYNYDIRGHASLDAARANWGGTWRLPTEAEAQELLDKCDWEWITQGGKKGCKVTGPSGQSIFLPAAGLRYGSPLGGDGSHGFYQTSTPYEDNANLAYKLLLGDSGSYVYWCNRFDGCSVRPVVSITAGGVREIAGTHTEQAVATTTTTTSSSSSASSSSASGTINGHPYVDLGLSVKWATCNVGASSPEDYGNYYAWGETFTKSSYKGDNSKTYNKSSYNYDIGGNTPLDAARAKWGGTWRLPTKAEMQELLDECTWTWTTQGGKQGYKVTGPSGRSIFLPAASFCSGPLLLFAGLAGFYWASTPDEDDADNASDLYFDDSDRYVSRTTRYFGCPVRPVSE